MQFTAVIATLIALLTPSVVDASPATELQPRSGGSIFICTDYFFGGLCDHVQFQNGVCTNFPAQFKNQISSVGPDGGWTCNLYVDTDCKPDKGIYTAEAPGFKELVYGNDAFSSVMCAPNN